jgi:hypothetical protein
MGFGGFDGFTSRAGPDNLAALDRIEPTDGC